MTPGRARPGQKREECPLAQLLESVPELLLFVHHDRAALSAMQLLFLSPNQYSGSLRIRVRLNAEVTHTT